MADRLGERQPLRAERGERAAGGLWFFSVWRHHWRKRRPFYGEPPPRTAMGRVQRVRLEQGGWRQGGFWMLFERTARKKK